MTIQNLKRFTDSIWDWGVLNGCFGDTRIAMTDVDGLCERNGRFLILEAKSPGVAVKRGQQILFDRLIELKVFTIIVLWGVPSTVEKLQIWPNEIIDADNTTLRELVSMWFESTR